ncbi:MAG: D-mannonate epimerase, partial [Bacteroidales bacterium]|nr:D-mannonate epimerase [Bacteroidales bacterium]
TPATLKACAENEELQKNLGAAAHLIHGSSEGRFGITYCPGKGKENLSRAEIESVGFKYADIDEISLKYHLSELRDGYNTMPDGEAIYYISNPALGLWAFKNRFNY